MGSMITYDRLVPCGTEFRPDLVFCPFVPALHSGNFLVWKKDRIFSRAAELLKKTLEEKFNNA